jgi:hypothetical protein
MLGGAYIAGRRLAADASSRSTARRAFPKTTRGTSGGERTLARIEGGWRMKTYEFDVILKGAQEITDEQADALFAAGCDDGTPACSGGLAWVHFDRESASLEDAIRSAIAQVQSAGFHVSKVELDADAAVSLEK